VTIYRVVIKMTQTFEEVLDVDTSNVQQARSQARAAIDSLEFKDLVDTDYRIESVRAASSQPLQKNQ
jgi:hypothetical protein